MLDRSDLPAEPGSARREPHLRFLFANKKEGLMGEPWVPP
jgi:hypothetical protein